MKRAVVVCIGILVLSGVVLAGNVEKNAGLQFKDWGISFTTPAQWQRWPSAKESAFATQIQQSVDAATLKEQVVHLAGWSTADEAAFMVLTVKHERSGGTLRLSDLLARQERDDKQAKEYGDATQINRLEIGKVGGCDCVVHDVTLLGGGRSLAYQFVSGPEQVEVQWLFPDAARFTQLEAAIDGVLKSLSLGGKPSNGEIHEAALAGDLKAMNELLKDNPDLLESKDKDGLTPLHYAAAKGQKEVVNLLLTRGADVKVRGKGGMTPLHLAAVLKDKLVVEMLLANKADVDAKDDNGLTPLLAAATGGCKAVAEVFLLNKADVNAKAINGRTPLHVAAIKGDTAMMELLLVNKASVNAKANDGITPLHFAAALGHKEVTEALLANKADVNAKDQEGRTPYDLAMQNGHNDVADLLRKHGAKQ